LWSSPTQLGIENPKEITVVAEKSFGIISHQRDFADISKAFQSLPKNGGKYQLEPISSES